MGRARRARRIAQTAAYGGGVGVAGLGLVGVMGYGLLKVEARMARRIVGQPFEGAPDDAGTYGFGPGTPLTLVVLGDSTAKGMGAEHARQTIGAIIANGVAAFSGRSVELTNVAEIGAESPHLGAQLDRALEAVPEPDVAVILVGANDVTHRIDKAIAVRHLEMTVQRLREAGAEVVVGTCPDLGAIQPVPQPLRLLARRWSRDLAAAQTVAVVEAGGRAVSVGDLLTEAFSSEPHVMFSEDRFHPSPAGYARVAAALLPSVSAALDLLGERSRPPQPDIGLGEGFEPVAEAATRAVEQPGTEVAPAEIAGQSRGPEGRWALLLHRVRPAIPIPSRGPHRDDQVDEARTALPAESAAESAAESPADSPAESAAVGPGEGPVPGRLPEVEQPTAP